MRCDGVLGLIRVETSPKIYGGRLIRFNVKAKGWKIRGNQKKKKKKIGNLKIIIIKI